MPRARIDIVNASPDWFIPYGEVSPGLKQLLEDALVGNLDDAFSQGAQMEGQYLLRPTDWRRSFGLQKIGLFLIDDCKPGMIGARQLEEMTLWYADRHGRGEADFLGYEAVTDSGGHGILNRAGILIPQDTYYEISSLIGEAYRSPARFVMELPYLEADVERITPGLPRHSPFQEDRGMIPFRVEMSRIVLTEPIYGLPLTEIDWFSLYSQLDGYYRTNPDARRGNGSGGLLPVPPAGMDAILDGMGVKSNERYMLLNVLVDIGLLDRVGSLDRPLGYKPTSGWIANYRNVQRRI